MFSESAKKKAWEEALALITAQVGPEETTKLLEAAARNVEYYGKNPPPTAADDPDPAKEWEDWAAKELGLDARERGYASPEDMRSSLTKVLNAAKVEASAETKLADLRVDLAKANALVRADPPLTPLGLAELAEARKESYRLCCEQLSRLRSDIRFCLREWAHEDVPPLDAAQAERWKAYVQVVDVLSRLVDGEAVASVLGNMPKLYCSQCFGPHPLPCLIHPDDKGRP